jgi:hypothetical protein
MENKMTKLALSRNWKMFFSFTGSVWLIIAILNLLRFSTWNWGGALQIFAATLLAIFDYGRLFDNLSIDSEGFTYSSLGVIYSGKWSVIKNGEEKDVFHVDLLGQESLRVPKKELVILRDWMGPRKYVLIPLHKFDGDWKESTLRSTVKAYL